MPELVDAAVTTKPFTKLPNATEGNFVADVEQVCCIDCGFEPAPGLGSAMAMLASPRLASATMIRDLMIFTSYAPLIPDWII